MTTTDQIALLRATRTNIKGILDGLTDEQVNRIPEGLNNNLIWNAGHVVATMSGLVYGLAGLPQPVDKEFVLCYRKGTRPEGPVSTAERERISGLLLSSVDQLETDLAALDFSNYREYQTSFGVTLHDAAEALGFNGLHEAMHLGTMLAIRNLVR